MLRYLALGDSYTIGEGVAPAERWPEQMAALLRADGLDVAPPEIIARTGWTTDELMAEIERQKPAGPYSLVTLLVGVNNQYRGRPLGEFSEQFSELLRVAVDLAGGDARRVVVVSIPNWGVSPFAQGRDKDRIGLEIDAFNESARRQALQRGSRFIDITAASRDIAGEGLFAADGLHPSGAMYERWAKIISPVARQALGGKPDEVR